MDQMEIMVKLREFNLPITIVLQTLNFQSQLKFKSNKMEAFSINLIFNNNSHNNSYYNSHNNN